MTGWGAYQAWRHEYEGLTDPNRYPIEWVDQQVWTGRIEAWALPTAGIIAEIRPYPGGLLEVHCMAAAGDLAGIMELKAVVEDWGRSRGCREAVVESRPGWVKLLKDYQVHQVAIRKVL